MNIIDAMKLRKEYGTLVAVRDVDFRVEAGQVVGLIGPNGAGKTTLLRMLATLLQPTRGEVKVFGLDIGKDYLEIRKRIGYLPDFFNLYSDLTLRECLRFFADSYGVRREIQEEKIQEVLGFVDLEEKKDGLIHHLSRGMVQRMGLATLLVRDPELYLLDEPASGLDPKARIQLREILKKLSGAGKTVIISSHILTELSEFCTHISIMNKGQIVCQGSVEEIRQTVAGGRMVQISVLDRRDEAAEMLGRSNLPLVMTDTCDSTISIRVSGGLEDIAAANKLLVENGIAVYSVREVKMDIEDLFMKISSEQQE